MGNIFSEYLVAIIELHHLSDYLAERSLSRPFCVLDSEPRTILSSLTESLNRF